MQKKRAVVQPEQTVCLLLHRAINVEVEVKKGYFCPFFYNTVIRNVFFDFYIDWAYFCFSFVHTFLKKEQTQTIRYVFQNFK